MAKMPAHHAFLQCKVPSMRLIPVLAGLIAFTGLSAAYAQTEPSPANCGRDPDIEGPCAAMFDAMPMNAIQAIGSHNSYHQRPTLPELKLIEHIRPGTSPGWDYGHAPLDEQLDRGMRQLELDVYYDPEGGRYADPLGPRLTAGTRGAAPYDAVPMQAPGFKVMHMQDIDVRSSCATLLSCLGQIRDWSDAHPGHVPLLIMFNTKQEMIGFEGTVRPLTVNQKAFSALEKEILTVFTRDRILAPDDVRQGEATLPDALHKHGWPTLGQTRGKVLFLIDENASVIKTYMKRSKALEGKLLFVKSVAPTQPHAAIFVENEPLKQYDEICQLVESGFIVRTRADANLKEARSGDDTRMVAALGSGAQFVTTDMYQARADLGSYSVSLPDNQVARRNPRLWPERNSAVTESAQDCRRP
jgi:hypothetical protein